MNPAVALSDGVITRYGHMPHHVADESQLERVGRYRSTSRIVMMLFPAAKAFQKMQDEARLDGVALVPISGFRSSSYQERLFKRALKKYGSKARAARRVAPPGYSEHHTGRAIDIGDKANPKCDVEICFEKTFAYQWLERNASRFGFELSFSDKESSVSYEPWHWRFIKNFESSAY